MHPPDPWALKISLVGFLARTERLSSRPANQRANNTHSASAPEADKLREASPGSVFRVSGHLFARNGAGSSYVTGTGAQPDARQRFEGAQANAAANVTNPQYLAQFTEVAAAGH